MKNKSFVSIFNEKKIKYLLSIIIFIGISYIPTIYLYKSFNDFVSLMCLGLSTSLFLGGSLSFIYSNDFGPLKKWGLIMLLLKILFATTISWILTGHIIVVLIVSLTCLFFSCLVSAFFMALITFSYIKKI